jgi:hypothetical protein
VKKPTPWIAALLVLPTVSLGIAQSQQPGDRALEEQLKKQEAIYQSRGESVPSGYVVGRSLLSYTSILPADFNGALWDLGPSDRWLDIGAGEGHAVLDYYTSKFDSLHSVERDRGKKKARAVAMSIEDRRTPRWYEMAAILEPDQIRYLHGKRMREYSSQELGRFRIITDHLGGFSYTRDLSLFMEQVLAVLELNGTFYSLLLDVRPQTEPDPALYKDLLLLTEIENDDGAEIKICSWLKSITCAQVTCELHTELKRPIELYRIQKTCDNVAVPPLVPLSYTAGTPPPRRFQLKRTTIDE